MGPRGKAVEGGIVVLRILGLPSHYSPADHGYRHVNKDLESIVAVALVLGVGDLRGEGAEGEERGMG